MNTYRQLFDVFNQGLSTLYEPNEIASIYHLALEHLGNKNTISYKLHPDNALESAVVEQLLNVLTELKTGKPIQYILGEASFFGLKLKVNEHVLIPRVETEELVDMIIKNHRYSSDLHLIDIGTGSGCIPIALAKHLKSAFITSLDVSSEAIQLAKQNAEANQTLINFRELDILEWDLAFEAEQYDVIVSNPPYIREIEKAEMHQNVLKYEPHLALFVADHTPLLFYSTIADFAKKHLKPSGTLYFEINQYLSTETADLLKKKGFGQVSILPDLNQVPRIIVAQQ